MHRRPVTAIDAPTLKRSRISGLPNARSYGNTWVTITPVLLLPSCVMKPDEALFDSVTTCAEEPAAAARPTTSSAAIGKQSTSGLTT